MATRIGDIVNPNGASDLFQNAPVANQGGWIEVDGDGNPATIDDKVLVNTETGEVYIGDSCKGEVKLDKVLDAAKATITDQVKKDAFKITNVILDDDNGDAATVNVNVDIGKLILDNDALTGGTATAKVNISGQTDLLKIVSDMDSKVDNIDAAGTVSATNTVFGVDVDMNVAGGQTYDFSGNNDIVFEDKDVTAAKLAGLKVNNDFDITQEGGTGAAIVTGKVIQNINYQVGEIIAQGTDIDWDAVFATCKGITDQTGTKTFIVIGEKYGAGIVKDVQIRAHEGVVITYEDGSTKTLTLAEFKNIAVYDKAHNTVTVVGNAVWTFSDGSDVVVQAPTPTPSPTPTPTPTPVKSDPTNHFGLHGNINGTNLEVEQNNKGKIGSGVGTLTWLARNDFSATDDATYNFDKIKQDLEVTVEGRGGAVSFDQTSGNYINNGKNMGITTSTVKLTEIGDSVVGDLGGVQKTHQDLPQAAKINVGDTKTYKQILDPLSLYDDILAKLKELNETSMDSTKFKEVAAQVAKDKNGQITDKTIGDLFQIFDGNGDNKITAADWTLPATPPPTQ